MKIGAIEKWLDALKYYQASDKERNKITASYNRHFKKLADEGYKKRESDDLKTRLVGIRICRRLWNESAEYDKMIGRVAFLEFWDEARKEWMKGIKKIKEEEKKP